MGENNKTWTIEIITLFSISAFYSTEVESTKSASAAQRSAIDTSHTLLFWTISLFKSDKAHEYFIWLQLLKFLPLASWALVFSEILSFPVLDLNKYIESLLFSPSVNVDHFLLDPNLERVISLYSILSF